MNVYADGIGKLVELVGMRVSVDGAVEGSGPGPEPGPTAKDYIQDGLVAMWDGIENAGFGTHNANAETWVDLSGNGYDMPLTNVSVNADNMGFDGTGSAYITSQEVCDLVKCIESVFTISEAYSGMIVQMGYATSPRSACLLGYSTGDGYGFRGTSTAGTVGPRYIFDVDQSKVIGQKISVSGNSNTADSASARGLRTLCVNGKSVTRTTSRQGGVTASTTGIVSIGSSSRNNVVPSTYKLYGNIYCIRLYSRDLTSDEIAANYAIDKARFNLEA